MEKLKARIIDEDPIYKVEGRMYYVLDEDQLPIVATIEAYINIENQAYAVVSHEKRLWSVPLYLLEIYKSGV